MESPLTNAKELRNLNVITKQVMLGKTPSIQYSWYTKNGEYVLL